MLLWGLVSGQGRLALLLKVVVDGHRYDNLERLGVVERNRVERFPCLGRDAHQNALAFIGLARRLCGLFGGSSCVSGRLTRFAFQSVAFRSASFCQNAATCCKRGGILCGETVAAVSEASVWLRAERPRQRDEP